MTETASIPSLVIAVGIGICLLIAVAYAWFTTSTGGTLGQRILGLRVVNTATGQSIGLRRGVLRLVGIRRGTAVVRLHLVPVPSGVAAAQHPASDA